MRVILIDDDEELLGLLKDYLTVSGIDVITASSGKEGLLIIEKEKIDLVILDVMMPGMSGLEVLKKLNTTYNNLPVMMLTARGDEIDRVLGLELGADDYLVKPFSSRELLARINAIKRRQEKLKKNVEVELLSDTSPVRLDMKKRKAIVRGENIELSAIEFDILNIFLNNVGVVLSRDRIMDLSRGKDFMALDRSIDIHVSRLRQKLEKNPQKPSFIKTVWGVGYVYTGEDT